MCISIIFAVNVNQENTGSLEQKVRELGEAYKYGIGMGAENVLAAARPAVVGLFDSGLLFEVHDLPEPHCACDIDQDIRNGSRNGTRSSFFAFVKDILQLDGIDDLSVLFFQDELPTGENVRTFTGGYDQFIELINKWHTWQVEAFEPTRQAYYIGDASPLLYKFNKD